MVTRDWFQAVLPGQPQDHWCRVCHRKLRVCTDGVRFTQLEPSRNIQSELHISIVIIMKKFNKVVSCTCSCIKIFFFFFLSHYYNSVL